MTGILVAALTSAGCQEKLTAPADCPALCPGGQSQVFDEVFSPIIGADSSFRGYVQPHAAPALLVSNGLLGFEERTLVRFGRRLDSVSVRDTLRAYTIDSVALSLTMIARDSNLGGLQVLFYRLSPSIDSTSTFAATAPGFVPESLIATIAVPDSVPSGPIGTVIQGAELERFQIAPADSGRLAVGVRIASLTPTGIRVGALASGTGATFTTYVTADIPDTGTAKLRTLPVAAAFNTFVTEVPPQPEDPTLLAVGGEPSARALLRFSLPSRILDSATVVRATLELTPVAPITGLPTDPARLQAQTVLADVGAKSPVSSAAGRVPMDTLEIGAGLVSVDAVRLVELWLGAARPSALMLSLTPDHEAASFTRPVFFSTRAADPAVRPRLRITYLLSFAFENP